MTVRGRSRRAAAVLALALFFGSLGLLGAALARSLGPAPVSYSPAAAVSRPAAETVTLPGAFAVRAFDGDGRWLYLLDPLAPAVRVLERSGAGWVERGSFGRHGGGPGEFSAPSGLGLLRDGRVAVADQGRIHFFTSAGAYLESRAPVLPCALPLPQLAGAQEGLFLHGSCLPPGGSADTMQMVLFWSADGEIFREVVRDPHFTADGRFGTAYGARAGLSDGEDHHLFGAGVAPCLFRIVQTSGVPVAERLCDHGVRAHRLELSEQTRASLELRRRRNPAAAGALRIPDRHPAYVERLVLPSGDAWLRGWSEDSLVVRLVGSQQDIAVLPYFGLLGCRRAGCLWSRVEAEGVQIGFLAATTLDSLARAAPPAAGRVPR